MQSPLPGRWSQAVKDHWFFAFLSLTALATLRVFWPFFSDALLATVVVTVSWPLFAFIRCKARGHAAVAAVATITLLSVAVFVPLVLLGWIFVREGMRLAVSAMQQVQQGKVQALVEHWLAGLDYESIRLRLPSIVQNALPSHLDVTATVVPPLHAAAIDLLNAAAVATPGFMNSALGLGLDALVCLALTVTLFIEGPALLQMLRDLSPMDDRHDDALFRVFGQLARNLVVGSLGTAAVMGLVAWIGYFMAGLDNTVFFAVLTGVFSFVPLVGTSLVWIPVSLVATADHGWWTGAFVFGWSILFTAQVDTLVRPFFMRGGLSIHPLAVLLAILGGVKWFGAAGALLGPVVVAMFLALHSIHRSQYLGLPDPPTEDQPESPPGRAGRWWRQARRRLSSSHGG
jgi:predicted PurR-regulated permease PerM